MYESMLFVYYSHLLFRDTMVCASDVGARCLAELHLLLDFVCEEERVVLQCQVQDDEHDDEYLQWLVAVSVGMPFHASSRPLTVSTSQSS